MFELLTWGVDGFEKHCFKKDEKFHHTTEAYLNMIGKAPWTSEAHENYLNYTSHAIDANPDVLHKIENYIEERLPRADKEERRSPKQQQRSKEKL
jgi:proline dehydrogenase